MGLLPQQDVLHFDSASRSCRAIGRAFWEQASLRLPCHLPQGSQAVRRSVVQMSEVLRGFGEEDVDNLHGIITFIAGANPQARVAQYGLLARLPDIDWLEAEHLRLICKMCRTSRRTAEMAAWLDRLLKRYPEQAERVFCQLVEDRVNDAWLAACLPHVSIGSHQVRMALLARDKAELVLAAIAPSTDLRALASTAAEHGASRTVLAFVRRNKDLMSAAKVRDALLRNDEARLVLASITASTDLRELGLAAAHCSAWRTLAAVVGRDRGVAVAIADSEAPMEKALVEILHRRDVLHRVPWRKLEVYFDAEPDLHTSGLDFKRIDCNGDTALFIAKTPEQFAYLLEQGADPGARNCQETTVLHRLAAAEYGWARLVPKVLEGGADINASDALGRTPLHVARNGDFLAAAVSAGGNLLQRDINGVTALAALMRGPVELGLEAIVLHLLYGGDVREITMRCEIDLGYESTFLPRILHVLMLPKNRVAPVLFGYLDDGLSSFGKAILIEVVTHRGCSLKRTNHRGQTLAHALACEENGAEALWLAFNAGLPVDTRDFDGFTPLALAAAKSHMQVCAALLAAGANPARVQMPPNPRSSCVQRKEYGSRNGSEQTQKWGVVEQALRPSDPTLADGYWRVNETPREFSIGAFANKDTMHRCIAEAKAMQRSHLAFMRKRRSITEIAQACVRSGFSGDYGARLHMKGWDGNLDERLVNANALCAHDAETDISGY